MTPGLSRRPSQTRIGPGAAVAAVATARRWPSEPTRRAPGRSRALAGPPLPPSAAAAPAGGPHRPSHSDWDRDRLWLTLLPSPSPNPRHRSDGREAAAFAAAAYIPASQVRVMLGLLAGAGFIVLAGWKFSQGSCLGCRGREHSASGAFPSENKAENSRRTACDCTKYLQTLKTVSDSIIQGYNCLKVNKCMKSIQSFSSAVQYLEVIQTKGLRGYCFSHRNLFDSFFSNAAIEIQTAAGSEWTCKSETANDLMFDALIGRSRAQVMMRRWQDALTDVNAALAIVNMPLRKALALRCLANVRLGLGEVFAAQKLVAEAKRLTEDEGEKLARAAAIAVQEQRANRAREQARLQQLADERRVQEAEAAAAAAAATAYRLNAERAARAREPISLQAAAAAAAQERAARARQHALLQAEAAAQERAAHARQQALMQAEAAEAACSAYRTQVDAYFRGRRDFDGAAPTELRVSLRQVERACPPPPGFSCAAALGGASGGLQVLDGHVRLLWLTPHRGPERVFGEFSCAGCRRRWSSGFSYADAWQKCRGCETPTYPYAQRPLLRGPADRSGPPHDQARCGMCRRLGRSCVGD